MRPPSLDSLPAKVGLEEFCEMTDCALRMKGHIVWGLVATLGFVTSLICADPAEADSNFRFRLPHPPFSSGSSATTSIAPEIRSCLPDLRPPHPFHPRSVRVVRIFGEDVHFARGPFVTGAASANFERALA